MRRFANLMLDMAVATFGIIGVTIGGYILYWLLTSPVIRAMVFATKPSYC
jgi:predicted esterase YcpF (UPF0227 family)